LAFLSFLLTFFDSTVAILFPLLYKPLEGGHNFIGKLAANCPEKKSLAMSFGLWEMPRQDFAWRPVGNSKELNKSLPV
jgi:hypothetical protein